MENQRQLNRYMSVRILTSELTKLNGNFAFSNTSKYITETTTVGVF